MNPLSEKLDKDHQAIHNELVNLCDLAKVLFVAGNVTTAQILLTIASNLSRATIALENDFVDILHKISDGNHDLVSTVMLAIQAKTQVTLTHITITDSARKLTANMN